MTTRPTYKPKRHIRHELYAILAVFSVPVALVFAFPYQAVGWRAEHRETVRPFAPCAFVMLTDEEADSAVANARATIKTAADSMIRHSIDLSVAELPEEETHGIADIAERERVKVAKDIAFTETPLPSSQAAGKAKTISPPPPTHASGLTFSREELLEINKNL